jgi:hypothetical protein
MADAVSPEIFDDLEPRARYPAVTPASKKSTDRAYTCIEVQLVFTD